MYTNLYETMSNAQKAIDECNRDIAKTQAFTIAFMVSFIASFVITITKLLKKFAK